MYHPQVRLDSRYLIASTPQIEDLIIDLERLPVLNGSTFSNWDKEVGGSTYFASYIGDEKMVDPLSSPIGARYFLPIVTNHHYISQSLFRDTTSYPYQTAKLIALSIYTEQAYWFPYLQACLQESLEDAILQLNSRISYSDRGLGNYDNVIAAYTQIVDHLTNNCLPSVVEKIDEANENLLALNNLTGTGNRIVETFKNELPYTVTSGYAANPKAYIATFSININVTNYISTNYNPFRLEGMIFPGSTNKRFLRYLSLTAPRIKQVPDLSLPGNVTKEVLASDLILRYQKGTIAVANAYYSNPPLFFSPEEVFVEEKARHGRDGLQIGAMSQRSAWRVESVQRLGLLSAYTEQRPKAPLVSNAWVNSEIRFDVALLLRGMPNQNVIQGIAESEISNLKSQEFDLIMRAVGQDARERGFSFFSGNQPYQITGPTAAMSGYFMFLYPGEQITHIEEEDTRLIAALTNPTGSYGRSHRIINTFDSDLIHHETESEYLRQGIPAITPDAPGQLISNSPEYGGPSHESPDNGTVPAVLGEVTSNNFGNGFGWVTSYGTCSTLVHRHHLDTAILHSRGQGARLTNNEAEEIPQKNTYRRGWNATVHELEPYTYEATVDIESIPWQETYLTSSFTCYRRRRTWTYDRYIATPHVEKSPSGNYWFGQNFQWYDDVNFYKNSWIWRLNQDRYGEYTIQEEFSDTSDFANPYDQTLTTTTQRLKRNHWLVFIGDIMATTPGIEKPSSYYNTTGNPANDDKYFYWRPTFITETYEISGTRTIASNISFPEMTVVDADFMTRLFRGGDPSVPIDYVYPEGYQFGWIAVGFAPNVNQPSDRSEEGSVEQVGTINDYQVKVAFDYTFSISPQFPQLGSPRFPFFGTVTPGYNPPIPTIFTMNSLNETAT